MRRPSYVVSGLLGGLTSLPVLAISYLGNQLLGLSFIPFDLFDWLARVLPGHVISAGIDAMVTVITGLGLGPISAVAKRMEQLQGIVYTIVAAAALGVIQALLLRRTKWSGQTTGLVVGGVGLAFFVVVEGWLAHLVLPNAVPNLIWLAVLIVGWSVGLGRWLAGQSLPALAPAHATETRLERRAVLKLAGASVATAVLAGVAGALVSLRPQASGAGQPLPRGTPSTPPTGPTPPGQTTAPAPTATAGPNAILTAVAGRDQFPVVEGTRPEVTANDRFYRIDIDAGPPRLTLPQWQLHFVGLFDRPRALSLEEIMAYPAVTQPITLSCISNPVGGDLISTGFWTGTQLSLVLKDLGLRPEVKTLEVSSEDEFFENVEMQDMLDPRTLLVYGMNGQTLPQIHGYPLRIYIPNRYGMKQPKWITSIEALSRDGQGYWVDRGWDAEAIPQTVSVIDVVAKDQIQAGAVPVGGIAWAGGRGIQKVEVRVDEGEWQPARLRNPLGPLTWVQWRYNWMVTPGKHVFQVRATDGTGALQTAEEAITFPKGATGYHSVEVTF